jgi:hypothetical protein
LKFVGYKLKKNMKKITLLSILAILVSFSLQAQTPQNVTTKNATEETTILDTKPIEKVSTGVSKIEFNETVHDFGNIPQNVPATCVFEYKNIGTEIISIEDATASCGCTKPLFSAEPLPVGKTGKLSATYNAASLGNFTKTITVKLSNGETLYISIKGNVEAPPANIPMPSN